MSRRLTLGLLTQLPDITATGPHALDELLQFACHADERISGKLALKQAEQGFRTVVRLVHARPDARSCVLPTGSGTVPARASPDASQGLTAIPPRACPKQQPGMVQPKPRQVRALATGPAARTGGGAGREAGRLRTRADWQPQALDLPDSPRYPLLEGQVPLQEARCVPALPP